MKLFACFCGILLLLPATAALSDNTDSVGILHIDITNATETTASLVGDPEKSQEQGFIYKRGLPNIPKGQSTTWILSEHPFSGPKGRIVYQWRGRGNRLETCTINYQQTYSGPLKGGDNTTSVSGKCSVYNDSTKPSGTWNLPGQSQVTLGKQQPT